MIANRRTLIVLMLFCGAPWAVAEPLVPPPPLPPIVWSFEAPADETIQGGIGNLRGWAVSVYGIQASILFIDGAHFADIPFGGYRQDIGDTFGGDYPDAYLSGFSMAFNFGDLFPGYHEFCVFVVDGIGTIYSDCHEVETLRYGTRNYVVDVDTSVMSCAVQDGAVFIDNLIIHGVIYDLLMRWNTESQKFELKGIN